MFVFNFKINKKKFLKIFTILIIIFAITIFVLSFSTIFKETKNSKSDNIQNVIELDSNNYTSFLKDCHENIDNYIGYRIKVTGYVYRLPDFEKNKFVLARTMLYDSNNQAVVVGILCESNEIKDYEDYAWITIEGVIEKGNYHGDIPLVNIATITKSKMPSNEFVYEPID